MNASKKSHHKLPKKESSRGNQKSIRTLNEDYYIKPHQPTDKKCNLEPRTVTLAKNNLNLKKRSITQTT